MQEIKKNLKKKTDQSQDKAASYYKDLLNKRKADIKQHVSTVQKTSTQDSDSFKWLTEHSRNFLAAGYVPEGVRPETRIREIANRAEEILGIKGFSNKFYDYMEKGFFSLSSPVWSNFGKKRGLPISCFGSYVADDMGNILYTQSEVGMMSILGGGTS